MPPPLNEHSRVSVARRGTVRAQARGRRVLVAASALFAVVAVPAAIAHGETTKQPVTINVSPTQIFTPTGLTVKTGESITIRASGQIDFGLAPINHLGPA